MPQFRMRQVLISAEQWEGDPLKPVEGMCVRFNCAAHTAFPHVHAPTGFEFVSPGDWVVTTGCGEHWRYKPDIFEQTYEPV